MKKIFNEEVKIGLNRTSSIKPSIMSESDIRHLPPVVQKYLYYVGVVGKEKIINVRIKFDGRIRSDSGSRWMYFKSEQYNFFDESTRIFYIKARKMGIPAVGLHLYKNEKASMVIKMAGLIKVVDARGKEMDQGETVTVFNDMCCMAPATLIDKNIKWEVIDELTVIAVFTNGNIKISATLYFNEKGELVNFISNDRFDTDGKTYKNYPWSTPVKSYKNFNGYNLASFAPTIYHKPNEDFCYGEFYLKEIEYNCKI